MTSLKHAAAYVHTHARIQTWRYRGTGSEGVVIWAGWGSAAKCVSHILFPISLSRQDFSLCSFLLEPETTGWALCQVFIFLSFILPFSIFLLACIGFIAFPSFPHARTVVFHSPPPFFLVHFLPSPLSLVPPLLLACLSLFSLPHFLCALQWFFRFFPTYSLRLSFPASFHPTLCLFSLPHPSPL